MNPSKVPAEDGVLIRKAKAGHAEAFGDLVRKYQDRVFNTCWRVCGHVEDARDLTQETFLKAYEHLSTFRQESGFYTWIFRVAVNLALSHRRQSKRMREVPWDEASGQGESQTAALAKRATLADNARPDGQACCQDLQSCVAQALHSLDDDHRAVVVLRDMEGLDYRQIGQILGVPPGTVKSRLHRARMTIVQAVRPALPPKE